jgi:hypothetical protein
MAQAVHKLNGYRTFMAEMGIKSTKDINSNNISMLKKKLTADLASYQKAMQNK